MPKKSSGELLRIASETTTLLTRAGTPRKRAPGAGAPPTVSTEGDPLEKIAPRVPASQKRWLEAQPGGINATIRRLIEQAMQEQHATQTD